MQEKKARIVIKGTSRVLETEPGVNLGKLLASKGLLPLPCGGRGLCGLCRVRVYGEVNKPTVYELARGLRGVERLACQTVVQGYVEVELPLLQQPRASAWSLLVEPRVRKPLVSTPSTLTPVDSNTFKPASRLLLVDDRLFHTTGDPDRVLLVDLGSTKIAYQLVSLDGGVLWEDIVLNPLNIYGADIVTRMTHVLDDPSKLQDMSESLRKTVGSTATLKEAGLILIAGNSVMEHFFNGLPIESLARKPFQPLVKDPVYSWVNGIPALTMPIIGGYVGGDAYSELIASLELELEKPYLVIDLGTNTETLLVSNNAIYATSTPAGPAFEGHIGSSSTVHLGGIVKAAITGERNGLPVFEVEYTGSPRGFLGSGLVSTIAELLRHGFIDENGRIMKGYTRVNGVKSIIIDPVNNVKLSQLDIREFQKATAAVKTSWRVLLGKAGLREEDVKTIVVSGSFGSGIPPRDLVDLGLLPVRDVDRIIVAGNMVLSGLRVILLNKDYLVDYKRIVGRIIHVNLAEEEDYMKVWIESLKLG